MPHLHPRLPSSMRNQPLSLPRTRSTLPRTSTVRNQHRRSTQKLRLRLVTLQHPSRTLRCTRHTGNSEAAIFPNANVETVVGGMPLKLPILTGAFGSTEVARVNWDALAIGAALSGVSVTIGENIAGMDIQATLTKRKSHPFTRTKTQSRLIPQVLGRKIRRRHHSNKR